MMSATTMANAGNGTFDVRALLSLLGMQRDRYRRLRKLADRQRLVIRDDEPQALLGVLSERQVLVNELTDINNKLSPYRESWTQVYQRLDARTRDHVRGVLEESNGLLAAVMASDREDAEMLGVRRQTVVNELVETGRQGRAAAAYASSAQPAASGNWTEEQA